MWPTTSLLESCDLTTCLPNGTRFWNRTSVADEAVLGVTSTPWRTSPMGFSVTVGPPVAHSECDAALALAIGAEATVRTAFGAEGPVRLPCWPDDDLEGLTFYDVTIPAGRTAVVS